jgi:hypothetical protein
MTIGVCFQHYQPGVNLLFARGERACVKYRSVSRNARVPRTPALSNGRPVHTRLPQTSLSPRSLSLPITFAIINMVKYAIRWQSVCAKSGDKPVLSGRMIFRMFIQESQVLKKLARMGALRRRRKRSAVNV